MARKPRKVSAAELAELVSGGAVLEKQDQPNVVANAITELAAMIKANQQLMADNLKAITTALEAAESSTVNIDTGPIVEAMTRLQQGHAMRPNYSFEVIRSSNGDLKKVLATVDSGRKH